MSSNQTNDQSNTLGLTLKELSAFLDQHEKDQQDADTPDREFVRWNFRSKVVQLTLQQGKDSSVTLPVATRNISRNGICVLHSAYIHKDTPCAVVINANGNNPQAVEGTVTRCAHISGRIHEVGIKFERMISTKDLLGLDPLQGAYSIERVDPSRLQGSVLLVTASGLDCDLLMMYLEDTQLIINAADNTERAIARAKKDCDLIIADYQLASTNGPELLKAIKLNGCDMPLLVLTSDSSEKTLDDIRDAGADGILTKPTSKDKLFQALAEFLLADGNGGPLYSKLSNTDAAFPLLAKFLSDVPRMALNLEKAIRNEKPEECIEIVRTLASTAAPLGFPEISTLAMVAERKLASQVAVNSTSDIRALIVACRRIKAKPAA